MLIDKIGDKYIIKITDATITETELKNNDSVIVQGSYKLNYFYNSPQPLIPSTSNFTFSPGVD